ncbi:MAG TPA: hypothetical protein VIF62_35725 [Labilithrix sp.]
MIDSKRARLFAAAAGGALLLVAGAARADEREVCATAADQAQSLRDDGKYRRAREQMIVCARDVCPGPIKRDCLDWLRQLDELAPTVVFAAKEGDKDLADVKVSMDGIPIVDHLDGKPVAVDLGKHTFKFEHGGQAQTSDVVIGAGQKGRNIAVVFGAAAPTTGTPPPPGGETGGDKGGGGSLVPAFIVGGIGVVALGSFAFFGLSGKSDVDDLQGCKPHCTQDQVDSARTKLIVADISLGVGVAAAVIATVLVVLRPKADVDVKTGSSGARALSVGVDFGPNGASMRGTF